MEDYYEILEVHHKASFEVIARAYKVLATRYHPDTQPHERRAWAEEQMKRVNQAFTVLKDPDKRATFDGERQAAEAAAADAAAKVAARAAAASAATAQATPRTTGVNFEVCAFHPGRPRLSTCVECRRHICAQCRILSRGHAYCTECARRARKVAPHPAPAAGRATSRTRHRRRVRLSPPESVVCALVSLALALLLYLLAAWAVLPPDSSVSLVLAALCFVIGAVFVFAMAIGARAQR